MHAIAALTHYVPEYSVSKTVAGLLYSCPLFISSTSESDARLLQCLGSQADGVSGVRAVRSRATRMPSMTQLLSIWRLVQSATLAVAGTGSIGPHPLRFSPSLSPRTHLRNFILVSSSASICSPRSAASDGLPPHSFSTPSLIRSLARQ